MIAMHRAIGTWHKKVDAYIVLSEFARRKFVQQGFPGDRIFVKPNFVREIASRAGYGPPCALFVGRLAPEKGLTTLLKAWQMVNSSFALRIIGEGNPDNIDLVKGSMVLWEGRRTLEETYKAMREAAFLVFPSEWYEPFGRTIIESFAAGTPVIAARIGACQELVEEGRTGLLFEPGNVSDLAQKLQWALDHPTEMRVMGEQARGEFEEKYTMQINTRQLLSIYEAAIDHSQHSTEAAGSR